MGRFDDFLLRLQSYSRKTCLDSEFGSHTYAELLDEYELWCRRLDELNVVVGSVVGIRADYSYWAIGALLALLKRDAIVALVPRDKGVAQYLSDACVCSLLDMSVDGKYTWSTVENPKNHVLVDRLRAASEGGIVIFTSGSTGRPKAALQSLERFLYKFEKPGRCFRTLAFLLFDHVAGLDTLFYTLANGGTAVLTRRRDPKSILELIELKRIEVLPGSPSFLRLLCAAGDSEGRDLSSLKIITYGSEPMDESTLARVNSSFPHVEISQKYGTTETGSPRSLSRGKDSLWIKFKSDGVETKVIDDVLWIRSEGTILGYLNAMSPVDEDGWYCTGDLVDVDGQWVRFRGRAVDTINVGGEKVSPSEVEQLIMELDFVQEVLVLGEPHELLGQVVVAKVVLMKSCSNQKDMLKYIRSHCRRNLASYKVPVRIEVVSNGLVSERQKVQRHRAG